MLSINVNLRLLKATVEFLWWGGDGVVSFSCPTQLQCWLSWFVFSAFGSLSDRVLTYPTGNIVIGSLKITGICCFQRTHTNVPLFHEVSYPPHPSVVKCYNLVFTGFFSGGTHIITPESFLENVTNVRNIGGEEE